MKPEKIASFTVDHTKLLPGIYVSRIDGDIITYDLRTRKPNSESFMDNLTMHSLEHMFATPLYNEGAACATALNELVNGKVFNSSEDTWREFIEAPIATLEGEGENSIQAYLDIYNTAQEYFKE